MLNMLPYTDETSCDTQAHNFKGSVQWKNDLGL